MSPLPFPLPRRGLLAAGAAAALGAAPRRSHAAAWPSRDITFIVPYGPGGSTDPISRAFCAQLEKILGVNIAVENKPGGAATIGTGTVIRARPDGHTIGLGSNSSLMFQPLINQGLAWSSADDFTSVVKLVDLPAVLAVRADAPWRNFEEFMAHVRANPRRVRASVSGLRTMPDLTIQQLNRKANVQISTVPFTGGGGEALLALLGGRVEANCGYGPSVRGQVEAGKVRVLAVFQRGRYEMFPDAASSVEAGYDVTLPAAYYVIAPKGLPAEVQEKLTRTSREAVATPEFIAFARNNGYTLDPKVGDAMKAELVEYHDTFRELLAFLNQRS
ncbi:exported protein [Caldovatus sediminis]|uniref:Exported protein n=1 Tax=Caldovatus sediminis TaxID=2041189 RepID=A0A8J2ZDM7_9PROT|nr:tripartite tricarboxylate transporter substrate binding protein [Caldovatus sediminis]GGG41761.1 exported protein [Caldovatus sediminis]